MRVDANVSRAGRRGLTRLAVVVVALGAGCCAPKEEYAAFALAGTKYTAAVGELLDAAGAAQVESTSWALVADNADKEPPQLTVEHYRKKAEADRKRLELVLRLQEHARLLGRYFALLGQLAASDAPEETSKALEEVAVRLTTVEKQIQVPEVSAGLGRLAVDAGIHGALRRELESRQTVIRRELELQAVLLGHLQEQIEHAQQLRREIEESEVIIKPWQEKQPMSSPERWVARRTRLYTGATTAAMLGEARQASREMKEAFEALIAGKLTLARINAVIVQIDRLAEAAARLR